MASKVQQLTPLLDIKVQHLQGIRARCAVEHAGEGQGKAHSPSDTSKQLERYSAHRSCEQHDPLVSHIGFFIGMYLVVCSLHTRAARPGVSALIVLDCTDTTHGYRVGREAFHEIEPHYRYTEPR